MRRSPSGLDLIEGQVLGTGCSGFSRLRSYAQMPVRATTSKSAAQLASG